MTKVPDCMRGSRRLPTAIAAFLFVGVFTALSGDWPEIYGFVTDPGASRLERLVRAPVHLADDVMIALRCGHVLRDTGVPAFNRQDLAQASTSYLSPYLFALLLLVLPSNISVAAYALLGLLSVALTLSLLVPFARVPANALFLIVALSMTQTNLEYAVTGWDHLFQAPLLVLAACLTLAKPATPVCMLVASLSLSVGTLFRPDGLLVAVSILVAMRLESRDPRAFAIFGLAPFAALMGGNAAISLAQFGQLMPTTARLKVGASPSMAYAAGYLRDTFLSYTALTVFVLLLVLYVVFRRILSGRGSYAVIAGCVATAVVASYNSDAFPSGRMFWAPACVMAAVMAIAAPRAFALGEGFRGEIREYGSRLARVLPSRQPALARSSVALLLGLLLTAGTLPSMYHKALDSVISTQTVDRSVLAQQYVAARWIDTNLNPRDGSIGLFFAGVGYHLLRFEIADFLGKADEKVARSEVRWGPPGHNKWDIDLTLRHWNVQAIIPAKPSDPLSAGVREDALAALEARKPFAFAADLALNGRVSQEFSYCYSPEARQGLPDRWGFFLRNEIAARHSRVLRCSRAAVVSG